MMQVVERPRFRQDLIAEAVEEGGHKFIDVGDPDNGQLFRFYEVEFSIACGMDGERDVAGLVQWAKDELGLMPSVSEVRNVIATLGQLGYLDQAAAARAAAKEPELAAGVVVQPSKQPAAGVEYELGHAGSSAAPSTPLPKGAEIDLGAPGAGAAAKAPKVPVENVALGAPGKAAAKSDVSLDLADHMGVKPADVKEAVRQSKQMSAVEVPKELLAQVEAPVPAATKPAAATKPVEAKPVEAKPAEAKPAEAKPAAATKPVETKPAAATKPVEAKPAVATKPAEAKKPVEKPAEKQPVVAEKPKAPPAPKQGVSPILIIVLVLALGGAGAYFAWRYLIREKAESTPQAKAPPVAPQPPQPPPPPPKPEQPKAKIVIESGVDRDIIAIFPGPIETMDATERDVESSDILARLQGAKRLEQEIATLDKEIEKRGNTVKAAKDALDKINAPAEGSDAPKPVSEEKLKAAQNAVDKANTALEEKQNARGKKEEDLEKLYIRAPFEGRVKFLAKQGQKLEENVVVAKITPKPAPTATFKLEKNAVLERGLTVPLKVGEKMHTCQVTDSTVDGTRVVCLQSPDLAEGQEAQLMVEL